MRQGAHGQATLTTQDRETRLREDQNPVAFMINPDNSARNQMAQHGTPAPFVNIRTNPECRQVLVPAGPDLVGQTAAQDIDNVTRTERGASPTRLLNAGDC